MKIRVQSYKRFDVEKKLNKYIHTDKQNKYINRL